ncbi:tail fiber protein [bacterium]|nr:tail fiber protein [bacterium]
MSLTKIEYGSIASSKIMNENFNYLESIVEALATNLANKSSEFDRNMASMNTSINNIDECKINVGMILPFVGSSLPTGFLLCDGSEIKIQDFSNLYSVIGKLFGSTDSTSFCLPDLRNKTVWGIGTHSLGKTIEPNLPNIKGDFRLAGTQGYSDLSGAFSAGANGGSAGKGHSSGAVNPLISFDASASNEIYSDSCSTVQPPAIAVNFIIKY